MHPSTFKEICIKKHSQRPLCQNQRLLVRSCTHTPEKNAHNRNRVNPWPYSPVFHSCGMSLRVQGETVCGVFVGGLSISGIKTNLPGVRTSASRFHCACPHPDEICFFANTSIEESAVSVKQTPNQLVKKFRFLHVGQFRLDWRNNIGTALTGHVTPQCWAVV